MSIEIKSRWTGEVLHTVEADTLENANLAGANLHGANLYRANLDGADLYRADLYRANLYGAQNLLQAYRLGVAAGNGREISTLQLGTYHVVIASDRMMIGCQNHTITDWLSFDETRIRRLGGPKAVEWAATWRPVIEAYLTASNASTKAEATGDRPE